MDLAFTGVFQFKISLKGIEPSIWRRIQVPADFTFWDLHVAIQDAMGWLDSHLHVFRIARPRLDDVQEIGVPDEDGADGILPGRELAISDYFSKRNHSAEYEYDFGDRWLHDVSFEDSLPREVGLKYPRCLAGERSCPPEDCGGIMGYQRFVEAILVLSDDEHEAMLKWAPGTFDPERFELHQIRFDDPNQRWETTFGEIE